jgi:hypothetical protein
LDLPDGFFVPESVMRSLKNRPDTYLGRSLTRRDCLRYLISGSGLLLVMPLSLTGAAEIASGPSLLDKYLGEELSYQIGYWLIGHVGDAKTGFLGTDVPGIYKISLEGHGIGVINFLLGGITYAYTSFCQYVSDQDRLRPVYFELKKKRGAKESLRTVRFDYAAREIVFRLNNSAGQNRMLREPMKTFQFYEDYLTLFYNFRHGYYGPIARDRNYLLPLYTKKQMQPVKLQIANFEKEKQFRSREFNKTDKHFFMQFQINPEDVSSGSGEIKGWLSPDAIPVKGTIEDVVFFGDLWGELTERQMAAPSRGVRVPDIVKNMF